jgi:endonuclease YncB( thermonuclease family)
MYTYFCKIERVIDGDTVVAAIDLGLHIKVTRTVRLYGIDAYEMGTLEGRNAKEYLVQLFVSDLPIVVQTQLDRNDKYGRLLGTFFVGTIAGYNINKALVDAGFAKVM